MIADAHMPLAANNGDGTFSPVVIDSAKEKMHCYDPIKAEALIPFRIMEPSDVYKRQGEHQLRIPG